MFIHKLSCFPDRVRLGETRDVEAEHPPVDPLYHFCRGVKLEDVRRLGTRVGGTCDKAGRVCDLILKYCLLYLYFFFNPWREFIASLGIHYYVECLHLVLCLTSSRTQTQFFFYFQPDGVISPFTSYCRERPAVAFTINLFTQTRKLKPSALSLTSNCRISQHLF